MVWCATMWHIVVVLYNTFYKTSQVIEDESLQIEKYLCILYSRGLSDVVFMI